MSELRSKPDKRKDSEAEQIWRIYLTFDPKMPWNGSRFLLPVSGARTSAQFGDIRHYFYAGGDTSRDYHRGTDFAVPVGTVVSAPAPGTVVMTADRMLTGQTVVLEHAPGVYSVYFHLSKILVKKGQAVVPGTKLALSGATGLVTGPHLHWEIRNGGVSVDALDFVVDGLLDTTVVSAVISSVERPIH
jgi:murein DD-endopeptidase MepM/ murein hydrolase activator NlpD